MHGRALDGFDGYTVEQETGTGERVDCRNGMVGGNRDTVTV